MKLTLKKGLRTVAELDGLKIDWSDLHGKKTIRVLESMIDDIPHVNSVCRDVLDNYEFADFSKGDDWCEIDSTWEDRFDECVAVLKFIARYPGCFIKVTR